MNMVYDVCVVGAGLWGSSAARHASVPGSKVCLVGPGEPRQEDRSSRTIFASHYDAGRNVRRHHGYHHIASLLTRRTFQSLLKLEADTGIHLNADAGFLLLGESGMVPSAETGCHLLTAEGVRERYPFLDTRRYGYHSAILFAVDAGHANPRMIVRAQQKAAAAQGCDIIDGVVESVEESGEQTDGEPLMRVVMEEGRPLLAKRVLLCTGAFTQLKHLLPSSRKLDLNTEGTFTVRLEVGGGDLKKLSNMPTMASLIDPAWNCYILPPIKYPDGKHYLKIGPLRDDSRKLTTSGEVRDWFLSKPDPQLVDKFKEILLSIVNGITPLSVQTDMCVCATTPTKLPYCDMVSPRLGLVIGGNGYGAMVSDEMGRMAAEMIAGGENWNRDVPKEVLKARFVTPTAKL